MMFVTSIVKTMFEFDGCLDFAEIALR